MRTGILYRFLRWLDEPHRSASEIRRMKARAAESHRKCVEAEAAAMKALLDRAVEIHERRRRAIMESTP